MLRASLIRAMALSPTTTTHVGPKGIEVHGARIIGKLDLAHVRVPFRLALNHSYIEHEMELSSAEIAELQFVGTHTRGLVAENIKVLGNADFVYGFRAEGRIHLVGADVGGFLSFDRATLRNPGSATIIGDRLRVKASVFFRDGFVAHGEVRLLNAAIQGDLNGHGGTFINPGGVALEAGGATVGGHVHLNKDDRLNKNFAATGGVSLMGAQIGGNVYLNNARFEPGSYLNLRAAAVKGLLAWTKCEDQARVEHVTLDLRDASVSSIVDSSNCWPLPGKLFLDGYRYRRFTEGPRDAGSRLRWVRRQPAVIADSYQQLARVLNDAGDPAGARDVLINLEFDRRLAERPNWFLWLWNWVLALTIGYGYAAWRALFPAIAIVALGSMLFLRGFRSGVVSPSDKDAYGAFAVDPQRAAPRHYPKFSAVMYSLDTFLPIVDFGQKAYWMPNPNRGAVWMFGLTSGWFLRLYLWGHIAFGWLLTTLVVAGITGLVKTG